MPAVLAVSTGLAWLGRQGTRAIAAIVFIAIALPPVGAVLIPFSAPFFIAAFVGPTVMFSPLALGLKLFAIVAGSLLLATVIRRRAGLVLIGRYADQINGLNILLVFVFVAAVMENVAARFLAAPLMMIGLAVLAFALSFALLGVTAFVFAKAGAD